MRKVIIRFNRLCFGGACSQLEKLTFEYEGGNFNVSPPSCPKYSGTVFDKIWDWRSNELNSGEVNTCLAGYNEKELATLICGWENLRPYYRLAWKVHAPALNDDCIYWVHPSQNRTLTLGELAMLAGWDRLPEKLSDLWERLPPSIETWISTHKAWQASGAWKEQDFESIYLNGKWFPEDSKNKEVKTFEFLELVPNNVGRIFPKEANAKLQ